MQLLQPPAPPEGGAAVRFHLRGVSMDFGAGKVLDDVSLELRDGEVHGLIGENGCGKSTLIKILAGFHTPIAGTLEVGGQEVPLPLAPAQFRDLGMHFVHQDLGLVPSLTATENLFVDAIARGLPLRTLSPAAWRARAAETFAAFDLEIDPDALVSQLTPTECARLAIVRAVHEMREAGFGRDGRSGLLVLDEPTVFLPREGRDQLYALVREVAAADAAVLFVSHDLDEVQLLTDRVTVLRDGRLIDTFRTREASSRELVSALIGGELQEFESHPRPRARETRPALTVRDVTGEGVDGVGFDVHPGEIVGLTGLLGSGFDALPYLLTGAVRAQRGEIGLGGRTHALGAMTPRAALAAGLAFVPGDRKRLGSAPQLSVADNMMLLRLGEFAVRGVMRDGALSREAARLAEAYDIRPRDTTVAYGSLSGGNQQKALIAKWLQSSPPVLLIHEPTQGVDVGARQQVFEVLDEAAGRGTAVVVASSDNEQLAQVCHRVLVLSGGRVGEELTGDDVDKHRISEAVYRRPPSREREI